MPAFTPDQWLLVLLAFVLGLILGMALLAMVTDWDSWREDQQGVEAHDVLAVMAANAGLARAAVQRLAQALPAEREATAVDGFAADAIFTALGERDSVLAAKLGL